MDHMQIQYSMVEWNAWKVLPGPKSIPIILISPTNQNTMSFNKYCDFSQMLFQIEIVISGKWEISFDTSLTPSKVKTLLPTTIDDSIVKYGGNSLVTSFQFVWKKGQIYLKYQHLWKHAIFVTSMPENWITVKGIIVFLFVALKTLLSTKTIMLIRVFLNLDIEWLTQ